MTGPLREGGGVKGRAIKEKKNFILTFFSNVSKFQRPLCSRRGGGLGLNGLAIKRRIFFAASLIGKELWIRLYVKSPPRPTSCLPNMIIYNINKQWGFVFKTTQGWLKINSTTTTESLFRTILLVQD